MIKAEEILRQDKYKELQNLVLICEAMDEFFEKKRTEMLRDELIQDTSTKLNQNEIPGHNHKKYGNKGFVCEKCILWVDMGEDEYDKYKGCSVKSARDYTINDGDCQFNFNKYKIINKSKQ